MIVRIISGGQTGADQGGLEAAFECKIPTGGYINHGWRTEDGNAKEKLEKYNLEEIRSTDYRARTKMNVQASDGTLIVGLLLRRSGTALTGSICQEEKKPCFYMQYDVRKNMVDSAMVGQFLDWVRLNNILILNVAGNRESRNPGIQKYVRDFLIVCLKLQSLEPVVTVRGD